MIKKKGIQSNDYEEIMPIFTPSTIKQQQQLQQSAEVSKKKPILKDWRYKIEQPKEHIIGSVDEGIMTRSSVKNQMNSQALISQPKPKGIEEVVSNES